MKMTCKHDYHLHSYLSSCSRDAEQTPEHIYSFAKEHGYDSLCVTDHLWDSLVPGASKWYEHQNVEHVMQNLPLPSGDIPFYFGCETEYCGGEKLGISKEHFNCFDFIVIPLNHFHMENFTRPAECNTPALSAELFMTRIEEITRLDLPWRHIGLAHLTDAFLARPAGKEKLGEVLSNLDYDRVRPFFRFFADNGVGIELNGSALSGVIDLFPEEILKFYRLARDCGCKFYCASDAHHLDALKNVELFSARVAEQLELRENDRYQILKRD